MDEVAGEMLTKAEAGLEAASAETLIAQSGTPSGKQPESSEFTQASGPSDNSSSLETAA
jgi:hypothetical protein